MPNKLRPRRVVETGDIFLAVTVILETEWVLRAGYGFQAAEIVAALRGLAGLPGVNVENPVHLATALDWVEGGMDFAEALHLARSGHCSAFISFDQKLAQRARPLTTIAVVSP